MSLDRIFGSGAGSIWQGDRESALVDHERFQLLVLCAEEFQPSRHHFSPTTAIAYAPNDDSELTRAQFKIARQAAHEVARRVRLGHDALVTCIAGRNRSGLVTAMAIHILSGCGGREAARIVRTRRTTVDVPALTNENFVRTLERIPSRLARPPRVASNGFRV